MSDHIDLDEQWLFHLAIEKSFQTILDEDISPEIISDPLIQDIYKWQLDHFRKYSSGASKEVLEDQFLSNNIKIEKPHSDINDLILRLKARYGRVESQRAIATFSRESVQNPLLAGQRMIEGGRALLSKLSSNKEVFCQSDLSKALRRYENKVTRGRGPSFGFKELDDYFYGQEAITFVVGQPKSLKSWFTLNSALANIVAGKTVVLYSLELPAEVADFRLRCMASDIPFWKYLKNKLEPHDIKQFNKSQEEILSKGRYIIEKPKPGERAVASLYQRAIDYEADILYIDQLQYVENRHGKSIGATNDTKEYFEAINDFKDLSDDGIPVWIVHQFNRQAQGDDFPIMQQIKGSAAIEECATLVLGLHSNKDMRKSHVVQIGTLASRNYSPNRWDVRVEMADGCNLQLWGVSQD